MAAVAAGVVGHRVRLLNLPFWMFRKVARQQRVDPFQIGVFRHYVEDNKSGAFEFEGGVTNAVEELTGTPAESFEDHGPPLRGPALRPADVRQPVESVRQLQPDPVLPGYNLERLDRLLGFPVPPNPSFSMHDERWRKNTAR